MSPIIYLTDLMADLHQDINRVILHLARAIMLRHKYIRPNENSSEFTYQTLNGALPTRK